MFALFIGLMSPPVVVLDGPPPSALRISADTFLAEFEARKSTSIWCRPWEIEGSGIIAAVARGLCAGSSSAQATFLAAASRNESIWRHVPRCPAAEAWAVVKPGWEPMDCDCEPKRHGLCGTSISGPPDGCRELVGRLRTCPKVVDSIAETAALQRCIRITANPTLRRGQVDMLAQVAGWRAAEYLDASTTLEPASRPFAALRREAGGGAALEARLRERGFIPSYAPKLADATKPTRTLPAFLAQYGLAHRRGVGCRRPIYCDAAELGNRMASVAADLDDVVLTQIGRCRDQDTRLQAWTAESGYEIDLGDCDDVTQSALKLLNHLLAKRRAKGRIYLSSGYFIYLPAALYDASLAQNLLQAGRR